MKKFYIKNKSILTRKEKADLMVIDSKVHGCPFFSDGWMKFFGSEIIAGMYDNETFITSEDNGPERTKKVYTARYYDWDNHNVITFDKSGPYDNLIDAINYAKEYNPNIESENYKIKNM